MVISNEKNFNDIQNKIINFIKMRGPVLSDEVSKYIGKDSIITSAFLSQLVSSHLLNVSHLKIGTSPLYYLPQQKRLLERFTNHLKRNEMDAFELLKEKKLVRSDELTPQMRVSMGLINDFAVPINIIKADGRTILYWKFYNLSNDDVYRILKERENNYQKSNSSQKITEEKGNIQKVSESQNKKTQGDEKGNESSKIGNTAQIGSNDEKESLNKNKEINSNLKHLDKSIGVSGAKDSYDKNEINQSISNIKKGTDNSNSMKREQEINKSSNSIHNANKDKNIEKSTMSTERSAISSTQKSTNSNINESINKNTPENQKITTVTDDMIKEYVSKNLNYFDTSSFFNKVVRTLILNRIKASNIEIIKKGKEYEFYGSVEIDFGNLRVFCVAKAKKSISEQDIKGLAYDVLLKKRVVVFLSNGKLSKKARELLNENKLIFFISVV